MCSWDVTSLFTNVPLDETIQICLDRLYSLPDPPQLPRSVLKDLLRFATKKSHFIFDGQYYDQIDGVAMGSPLGPVLANIFMCHFEEKWLMNSRFCPSLWFRYVDDTFTMFDSKDNANEFLSFLNGRHDSIKFTLEFEEDNKIPFLDILLKRCPENTFSTSVYRKKTFTGLYTKWDSFTPRKYKINLIRTLAYRCFRICSSPSLLQAAIKDLRKLLLQNGYPQGVITFNINDVLNKNKNKSNNPVQGTVPQKDILIVLPYLGPHTICSVKTTFAAHYIISISYLVVTETPEWLINKQGTVIHTYEPINYQENAEIQLELQDESSVDEVFKEQVLSELAANPQTTEYHSPSAI
ncbi:uncharacterized protein [Montipora foliosa]|uniref:uncharacterized protein n=1 Tax=Montipora foliosa TaxID=591990 RepID=UPI0035F111F9